MPKEDELSRNRLSCLCKIFFFVLYTICFWNWPCISYERLALFYLMSS